MKLIRFGNKGNEKPGILGDDNKRRDASHLFKDWNNDFFENDGLKKLEKAIGNISSFSIIDETERWAAPIARPGKVICIGLNYSDHAAESGMKIPDEPIVFMKAPNTVVGAYDNIIIPKKSKKTDWEVELAFVIKKELRYLEKIDDAKNFIAGYTIANDVSEREFQLERGGQWTKGKSCDNFCPIGPYLITSDEIEDQQNLALTLSVNGKQMQNGSTSKMIFNVYYITHYLSQFMTLEAGDLVLTGTPPGVALGGRGDYLKADDVVELSIEKLGMQKQICINA
ncbi:MAG TPA: fumarylacetoacetate hydrolase family protein [Parafilimonas sp.]|jgi:2-keto-4-pentenoate hydratase/2-oxohepta-3-ene-1,7-dioic acid hydratase in catechol pathway